MAIKTDREVKFMMLLEKLGIAKPVENTYTFNQAMNEHSFILPDFVINLLIILTGIYVVSTQPTLFLPIIAIAVFYFGAEFFVKNIK